MLKKRLEKLISASQEKHFTQFIKSMSFACNNAKMDNEVKKDN